MKMKIEKMKENITLEEIEAFRAGYSESSKMALSMLSEFLKKVNTKAPNDMLKGYGISIAGDFVDNIIKRTDGVRDCLDKKIQELQPLKDMEKKETTIRH